MIIPKHIAIIMDGNGRWAESKGLPRLEGHRAGLESVKTVIKCCLEKQVGILSLFAFSSENWRRPAEEINFLMQIFMQALKDEIKQLHEKGIRLRFLGDKSALVPELQAQMTEVEKLTQDNKKLMLNVAINYGGQWDIIQAVKQIAYRVQDKKLMPEDITDQLFESFLSTHDILAPDLFIRTSGEQRVSNFFLWQLAYTELYFPNDYWPDFSEQTFDIALKAYAERERRYGQTSQQLKEG